MSGDQLNPEESRGQRCVNMTTSAPASMFSSDAMVPYATGGSSYFPYGTPDSGFGIRPELPLTQPQSGFTYDPFSMGPPNQMAQSQLPRQVALSGYYLPVSPIQTPNESVYARTDDLGNSMRIFSAHDDSFDPRIVTSESYTVPDWPTMFSQDVYRGAYGAEINNLTSGDGYASPPGEAKSEVRESTFNNVVANSQEADLSPTIYETSYAAAGPQELPKKKPGRSRLNKSVPKSIVTTGQVKSPLTIEAESGNSAQPDTPNTTPATIKKIRRGAVKKERPDFVNLPPLPIPARQQNGLYFSSAVGARRGVRGLKWGPEADATLPANDQAREAIIKELMDAIQDMSAYKDKESGPMLKKRWVALEKTSGDGHNDGDEADQLEETEGDAKPTASHHVYQEHTKEAIAWEILDVAERIYREGAGFVKIFDPVTLKDCEKWRYLNFQERIDMMVKVCREFKSRVDKMMRGGVIEEYVLCPGTLLRNSTSNRFHNDVRSKDIEVGRKRDGRPNKRIDKADKAVKPERPGGYIFACHRAPLTGEDVAASTLEAPAVLNAVHDPAITPAPAPSPSSKRKQGRKPKAEEDDEEGPTRKKAHNNKS